MKKTIKNKQIETKFKTKKDDHHFNYSFESNPTKLSFLEELPISVGSCVSKYNGICLFKSIEGLFVLSYFETLFGKTNLYSYNLIDKKIIHQIKRLKGKGAFINHFLDNINKRDLLLQIISGEDYESINNIYIWNFNNLDCILLLQKIYEKGLVYSASLLKENNQFYLITSNNSGKELSLPLKVFDLNGNKVKEINKIKSDIKYMHIYNDKNLKKNFIVLINNTLCSYDYSTNKLYKTYYDKKGHIDEDTVVINDEKKPVKIMECNFNGEIRIFNFHTGSLLFESRGGGPAFCYWNDNYVFVAENYDRFSLINITSPKVKQYFTGHKSNVYKILKIFHPTFGECLITFEEYQAKLWIIKKDSRKKH